MDTKLSINRKFKRMFANILSIVAILAIAFPAAGNVSAQGGAIIKISTSNNYLRADNFAPNTTVTFTVYAKQDTNEDPIWIDSRRTDGSGFAIIWPWDEPQPPDLVVGNYIVASDGTNEKQLVLELLTIDVFNPDTDFVAGTALPGESVWVVVGNDDGYPADMGVTANTDGIWKADFDYDFSDDMWGSAEVADNDGDVTVYHLGPTPTPSLIAFPENDAVEAWEWPDGASVYLTIDNAPEDFVREGTAEVTSWGDPRTYIRFDFAGEDGYDLQVGDMVTLTDQFGQSATHTVQSLSVTEVNEDTDTVAGIADIDAVVQIWPHGYDQDFFIEDTAEDGTWFADFGSLGFHTIEETGGRAQVVINGNATAVNWNVPEPPPNPHFTVFPEWEFFDGLDWPDGAIVTITVAGKPECETTKESWDGFFNGNFGEGCDIVYGDEVTFTDGTTTRTHNVRTLYVTNVDMAANTVSGKAEVEAGTIIYVWAHDGNFEPLQFITTGSDVWSVNLSGVYTIRDDSEGRSEIRDEMGNATASDWHVTHPHFTVFPEWEWFDGNDWPNEAEIAISVADKDGTNKPDCETTKESWGYFFNGSFGEQCDLEIGDTVTFKAGETVRIHTVQNLAVTKVDPDDDTIKGIADAGAEVYAWPHATGQEQLAIAKTNGQAEGKWNADFSGIIDLVPGECGRSEIRDEFANSTAVDWCIPNPTFVAYMPVTIVGYDWPVGDTIDLSINDGEYTAQSEVGNADWDPTVVLFELGDFSMEVGDHIVMIDKTAHVSKDVWVTNLAVTDFDLDAGQVFGTYTYDPESESQDYLWVWLYDGDGQVPMMNPDDTWIATFDELPPGAWGGATQWDGDGDGTSIDFQLPNPNLYAVPDENKIYAQEWIAGIQLDLKIYDSDGNIIHSDSQVVESPSEVPWTVVVFDYDDLSPGQRIVLGQRGYERELLVSSLMITSFDLVNQQVKGTGDAGAQIFIRINSEDVWGEVDSDSNWVISHPQLAPGVWGEAIQPDGIDGDETRDGFQAPDPNLYAVPDENRIFANGWVAGTQLELKIYKSNGDEIYFDTKMVEPPSIVPWTLVIFDTGAAGFDLLPDQRIVLNQAGYERELLVSSLTITTFDLANQQVIGTGDAGAQIFIRINGEDVWGEVDSDSNWAISHPQLDPGVWGEAIQPDGIDGDETRDGFQAPYE
jgi:hypothetical protein